MTEPQDQAQPKVLVIDDDKLTHQLVGAVLQKAGYKVLTAFRGEEGLELARATKPQLIILDIMMPGLNGFEVMRYLKTSPTTASIPVIFLSGQVHQADKSHAKNLGAADYLEKPFERQDLLRRVDSHVGSGQKERNLAYYNDRLTQVAMEALALLTSGSEVELDLDVPPDESFKRLLAKIDFTRQNIGLLIEKWPQLAKILQGQDENFPLILAETRDGIAEISDLASHLCAIATWPPN